MIQSKILSVLTVRISSLSFARLKNGSQENARAEHNTAYAGTFFLYVVEPSRKENCCKSQLRRPGCEIDFARP